MATQASLCARGPEARSTLDDHRGHLTLLSNLRSQSFEDMRLEYMNTQALTRVHDAVLIYEAPSYVRRPCFAQLSPGRLQQQNRTILWNDEESRMWMDTQAFAG